MLILLVDQFTLFISLLILVLNCFKLLLFRNVKKLIFRLLITECHEVKFDAFCASIVKYKLVHLI